MAELRSGSYAKYLGGEFPLHPNILDRQTKWMIWGDESGNVCVKYDLVHQVHYLPITPDQVESAYRLETWARYKGYDFFVRGYDKENDTYGLSIPWEMSKELVLHLFGITRRYGHDDDTPFFKDVEFEDIWELRSPIEGFRFVGPEKVYLKKEGVWLDEFV